MYIKQQMDAKIEVGEITSKPTKVQLVDQTDAIYATTSKIGVFPDKTL